jgi:hypothetical protein
MTGEQLRDCAAQRASTVAVNYAHFTEAVQESFVQKLVRKIDRFVGLFAD